MGFSDRDWVFNRRPSPVALSSFATKVYGWMSGGLALTALIAYAIYATGFYQKLMPFWWVWGIATFGIALVISARIETMTVQALAGLFMAYAALEGIFFGTLLPGYAKAFGGEVIWSAFGVGSLVFLMALAYGIFTKADLTKIGRILSFAVIGLLVVSLFYFILSFFFTLTLFNLIISYLGLAIFVGLTAWDAQQIRNMSMQAGSNQVLAYKLSLIMALRMYVNVIMIFWYLLQIFSSSRR